MCPIISFLYEPYTKLTLLKSVGRTVCVSHEGSEACGTASVMHTMMRGNCKLQDDQATIALKCDNRIMKGYLMITLRHKANRPYVG
jgi:hypothetical protein